MNDQSDGERKKTMRREDLWKKNSSGDFSYTTHMGWPRGF